MKKIGIITFHRAKNYGAVLQAYALQHTLEQLGSDCEIVDYKCENIDNGYKPFQFSKTDPIKSILKSLVMYRKRAKKIILKSAIKPIVIQIYQNAKIFMMLSSAEAIRFGGPVRKE